MVTSSLKVSITMINIMIDDVIRLYVSKVGKKTDDFVQNPLKAIQSLEQHKLLWRRIDCAF